MTPTVRVPIGVHTQTSLISHHRATDFIQSPFAVTFLCGSRAHMRHAPTSHGASARLSKCPPISPSPHLRLTALEAAPLALRAPHSEAARDRVAGRRRRRVGTSARTLPERRLTYHGVCRLAWAMELCSVCGRHLAHMLSKACAPRVRVADGVRRLTIREALIAVAVHAVLAIPALVLGVDRLALRVLEACD